MKVLSLFSWITACAFALQAGAAHAQAYPSRHVTAVLPLSGGTSIDVVTRFIGTELSQRLGQPIVIENKPGASGNIGALQVAKAPADGYTILVAGNNLGIAPSVTKSLPWDPQKAFTPVAMLFTAPMVLAVNAKVPAKSLPELIALAQKQPTKLNYATPGAATPHNFGMELLKQVTGMQLTNIPYKGTGGAITDLVGGQVEIGYFSLGNLLPYHKTGRVRIIATSSESRLPQTPEVPTLRELGFQKGEINSWIGMFVPTGTPADIVARLRREVAQVMKMPKVRAMLLEQNVAQALPGTAEHMASEYTTDLERWPKVAAQAGIVAE
jgi:tripartite-type tricarboxylate transporter receptor subunit TctC